MSEKFSLLPAHTTFIYPKFHIYLSHQTIFPRRQPMNLKEKRRIAKNLSQKEKDDIKRYYAYGWSRLYLARKYNIPYTTVKRILREQR